jgi:hypothetical protein
MERRASGLVPSFNLRKPPRGNALSELRPAGIESSQRSSTAPSDVVSTDLMYLRNGPRPIRFPFHRVIAKDGLAIHDDRRMAV